MLSILIPSMNRFNLLRETIVSFIETCPNDQLQFSLVLDGDIEYLGDIIDRFYDKNINFVIDYSKNKRGAINAWNRALQISSGELVLIIGDDHKAHPGWYEKALEAHNNLGGYGVVGLNDLMHDGSLTTATTLLVDRKFIKEQFGGRITYPCYHYYCQDSELHERAKRTGKFIWLRDAIIEHIHAANGKREFDEHDRERTENEWQPVDMAEFERRKQLGFPNDWEPVI